MAPQIVLLALLVPAVLSRRRRAALRCCTQSCAVAKAASSMPTLLRAAVLAVACATGTCSPHVSGGRARPLPPPAAAGFELVLGLPLQRLVQFEELFWRIADPRDSQYYLRHLSREEVAARISPSSTDVAAAAHWLR